jgi:hypothetical protein
MDGIEPAWRKSTRSGTSGNCVEVGDAAWRKSSRSANTGNCVEVGDAARAVLVRDTTNRDGAMLALSAPAWARFTTGLK